MLFGDVPCKLPFRLVLSKAFIFDLKVEINTLKKKINVSS
jgi:hypothetical protein